MLVEALVIWLTVQLCRKKLMLKIMIISKFRSVFLTLVSVYYLAPVHINSSEGNYEIQGYINTCN